MSTGHGLRRQSPGFGLGPLARLTRDRLLELAPNVDHRRSQLGCLTEHGRATYAAIDGRQAVWVNGLASGIARTELETAARVLDELCRRLEAGGAEGAERNEGGNE